MDEDEDDVHFIVWQDERTGNLFILDDDEGPLPQASSVFDGTYEECKRYIKDNQAPPNYIIEPRKS